MLLEDLMEQLKAALEERSGWSVYYSHDVTPFSERPAQFLVLGIESIVVQDPFLTVSRLCYAYSAKPQVTLVAPAETDVCTAYNTMYRGAVSGMLSAGCMIREIRSGTPEQQRQLNRLVLSADFEMHGLFRISREEVGA